MYPAPKKKRRTPADARAVATSVQDTAPGVAGCAIPI
jgi:hypothetical protein